MKNVRRLIVLISVLIFISCGNDKKEEDAIRIGEDNSSIPAVENNKSSFETDTTISTAAVDSIKAASGMVEVILTGNDQMQYNLREIKVKAGQKVKLTLKHIGKLDVSVMGHNFVLLKRGTDIAQFALNAGTFKENNYVPKDSDKMIVHTKMIGGGEETSIEFTAPAAGTYDYICSFPGHYVQMNGKFIVE